MEKNTCLIYDFPCVNQGIIMKQCSSCEQHKDLCEFSLRSNGKNYLSQCKICCAKRSNEWYWKNREKSLADRKKRYQDTKEETLRKSKERYLRNHDEIRNRANEKNRTPERRKKAKERMKKWVKENSEKIKLRSSKWKRDNPLKAKAHQYVLWALRLNVIKKPIHCEACQEIKRLEAHHVDYEKPLEVEWLCKLCHEQKHRNQDDLSLTG